MHDSSSHSGAAACDCLLEVLDAGSRGSSGQIVGHVHSMESCGAVDGPGLRYVLFLSGCPLRCLYCHNPDAQGAPAGRLQTIDETVADILRYRSFIRSGGLTISGGEPLLQAEFVQGVFERVRREGIHTALDTSGFLGDRADARFLDETDLVLLDIKSSDAATYQRVTGVSLEPTLRFADRLNSMGKPMWVRFVLVPGLTDAHHNVAGVANYVATLKHVQRVEILPFHKLGEHKYRELRKRYELQDTPEPTSEQLDQCRQIFQDHGVTAR